MKKQECAWCELSFGSLERLVAHLVTCHRFQETKIGKDRIRFKIYNHSGFQRFLCLCGRRFTCNQIKPAPLFEEWAVDNFVEIDSFVAHLRREGGLKNHLQKLRDEAMMAKIAGCVE